MKVYYNIIKDERKMSFLSLKQNELRDSGVSSSGIGSWPLSIEQTDYFIIKSGAKLCIAFHLKKSALDIRGRGGEVKN